MGFLYLVTSPSGRRYVGVTTRDTRTRWLEHTRVVRSVQDTPLARAIKKYGAETFSLRILAQCENDQLEDLERRAIAFLRTKVPWGYNATDGGDGVCGMTPETKAKLSAANRGKPLSLERRAAIGAAHRAVWARPGYRDRMSHRKRSLEQRAAMSAAGRGKPKSLEHRAAISAAQRGKPKSLECRAAISSAHRGKLLSLEHRAALSASLCRYWARRAASETEETP